MEKYNIELDNQFDGLLGSYTKKPWSVFINKKNRKLATPDALDLLDKMLRYDHQVFFPFPCSDQVGTSDSQRSHATSLL